MEEPERERYHSITGGHLHQETAAAPRSLAAWQGATTHPQAGKSVKPHCCRVDVWTPQQPRGEQTSGQLYSNQGQHPSPMQRTPTEKTLDLEIKIKSKIK